MMILLSVQVKDSIDLQDAMRSYYMQVTPPPDFAAIDP